MDTLVVFSKFVMAKELRMPLKLSESKPTLGMWRSFAPRYAAASDVSDVSAVRVSGRFGPRT